VEFNFKNDSNANELISQLQLGQVIKVQVLEKTSPSQYIIAYRNYKLSAVSEVDLMTKTVWLKLTQKVPFPKLQLIIEENDSRFNKLLKYAEENDLLIFNDWYAEKLSWGMFDDVKLFFLLDKGVTIQEIMSAYQETVTTGEEIEEKLTVSLLDDDTQIQRINDLLSSNSFKLYQLYIRYLSWTVLMPIEFMENKTSKIMSGLVKTKHYGKVSFKYIVNKTELSLFFESMLYLNSLKTVVNGFIHSANLYVGNRFICSAQPPPTQWGGVGGGGNTETEQINQFPTAEQINQFPTLTEQINQFPTAVAYIIIEILQKDKELE
jgi:hypothetical protein